MPETQCQGTSGISKTEMTSVDMGFSGSQENVQEIQRIAGIMYQYLCSQDGRVSRATVLL